MVIKYKLTLEEQVEAGTARRVYEDIRLGHNRDILVTGVPAIQKDGDKDSYLHNDFTVTGKYSHAYLEVFAKKHDIVEIGWEDWKNIIDNDLADAWERGMEYES